MGRKLLVQQVHNSWHSDSLAPNALLHCSRHRASPLALHANCHGQASHTYSGLRQLTHQMTTFTVIHNFMAAPALARHWRRNLVTGEDNAVPAGAHRWWAHLTAQKERKKRKSSALGHELGKGMIRRYTAQQALAKLTQFDRRLLVDENANVRMALALQYSTNDIVGLCRCKLRQLCLLSWCRLV